MPKISVGRGESDREEHGLEGTGVIGRHLVGENEEAHMANPIYFDIATPHVIGVFGKRGTGKCLLPGQSLLTEEGLRPVEEVFHEIRKKGEAEISTQKEQLYEARGSQVVSVSEHFKTKNNEIKAAYRKHVDEKLLKIQTKSGREITVTKEHPLLKVHGWTNADNLEEGERIAVPRNIDLENNFNRELRMPEHFDKTSFATINERESELLKSENQKITQASDGTGSYREMVKKAEKKGLVEVKQNVISVTGRGQEELEKRRTENHYRSGKSRPIKVPKKVTRELAVFLSYLLAEGHEQQVNENNYRIIFVNKDKEILQRFKEFGEELFGLNFKQMDENTVYSNSKALQRFLDENNYSTGQNSFDKKIPGFIITSSDEVASEFLKAYFDCEGNVTNQQVELTTASRDIADAISYMLLRFGVIGRITTKKKYATNTEEQKVREYYQITISGSEQIQKFNRNVGFNVKRKSDKLDEIVKVSNTNVDTIPCSKTLKKCRNSMGADRTQISKHKQSLKAYEDGKYCPSRKKLREIIQNLEEYLKDIIDLKAEIEKNPDISSVTKFIEKSNVLWKEINQELGYNGTDRSFLSYSKYQKNPEKVAEPAIKLFNQKNDVRKANNLLEELTDLAESDVFWDEIEKITEINYEGWVYDLTVETNHSFTAGFGGVLCHNSYTLGTIAEEIQDADISDNLSTIMIDPMGIYWSMKKPNERMAGTLEDWDKQPEGMEAKIYIPKGKAHEFDEKDMPYDKTFTVNPGDFSASEWRMAFGIDANQPQGILLDRLVAKLKEEIGEDYDLDTIIRAIPKFDFKEETKKGLENRFMNAQDWGVFGEKSSIEDLTERGELSIIDLSVFGSMSEGWSVRGLVVGLIARKMLVQRMAARRMEELDEMEGITKNEMPIIWMLIDEAHQFIPNKGKTPATKPLLRWVKIGREPGVSLVLCTQQPAKLHPNALSQCDVVMSHRLTAKQDIQALGEIMQSYMRHDLKHYIDALPDRPGTALILDDNSERVYPAQMRPRKSWHAGGTPDAFD